MEVPLDLEVKGLWRHHVKRPNGSKPKSRGKGQRPSQSAARRTKHRPSASCCHLCRLNSVRRNALPRASTCCKRGFKSSIPPQSCTPQGTMQCNRHSLHGSWPIPTGAPHRRRQEERLLRHAAPLKASQRLWRLQRISWNSPRFAC